MGTDIKTKPTRSSVRAYLDAIADSERRADCRALTRMMSALTGAKPVMWGTSIVGFGRYTYRYASGREGEMCLVGFAARKSDITIYTQAGFKGRQRILDRLGKHTRGLSCLHLKRLAGIDRQALEELLESSIAEIRARSR
jgi:hypothetical protein